MKKRYIWIIVILIIIVAFFAFGRKMIFKKEKIQYRTSEITEGEIRETVTATGTLGAVEMVNVGTQVSGTIARINVDFNSHVRKGEVIAQIDPTSLQTAVTEAEANLQKAKLNVQLAKLQMDPILTLSKQNLVSQSDVDNARISFELAQANVKTSQAQLSRARTNLENATILAPISGIVIARAVDVGQTVAASFSTPTLFSIAKDLTQMEVIASVDEADIGKIKTGQSVTFNVDAFPDREYNGSVTQIRMQPSTDNNVVTYNVVISAMNEDQSLLPGMTANLTILVAMKDRILKAPVAALRFKPASSYGKEKGQKSDSSSSNGNRSQAANATSANTTQGQQQTAGVGQSQQSGAGQAQGQSQRQRFAGMGQGRGQHRGFAGLNKTRKPDNAMEPGKLYILVNDTPQPVKVMTGLSDGTFTEIKGNLKAGDEVIIGIQPGKKNGNSSQNQAPGFGPGPRGH
jgi:HlyD family secretion protein